MLKGKTIYNYPVIFTYLNEGVKIRAVDFEECSNKVEEGKDAVKSAMELLAGTIIDYENKNKKLPESTDISKIELEEDEKLLYINAWMPYFRNK